MRLFADLRWGEAGVDAEALVLPTQLLRTIANYMTVEMIPNLFDSFTNWLSGRLEALHTHGESTRSQQLGPPRPLASPHHLLHCAPRWSSSLNLRQRGCVGTARVSGRTPVRRARLSSGEPQLAAPRSGPSPARFCCVRC